MAEILYRTSSQAASPLTQSVGFQPVDPATGRLWLSRLMVTAFRNYARATLTLDQRPVVLTGPNGAGKTNLLEAVSFLAPGRGLRGAALADVSRRAKSGVAPKPEAWAVAADVMTPEGPRSVGTGRDPADAVTKSSSQRRLVKIDGTQARGQQQLSELVALVWLTPQMDGLFRDSASGRRRFLDRLVYGFDPAHAGRVRAYEHALRERARLLKTGDADPAWLSALEETLAGKAVAISAARRELVQRLTAAHSTGRQLGPVEAVFPHATLALSGEIEAWLEELPALAVEERLRASLANGRSADGESGGAAVGPHRSDLLVEHLEKGLPAALCSTGEQKALLISLVLAHARLIGALRGVTPLLLLDEVVAHLDALRRRALFETILELTAQAWMTGTDSEIFEELGDAAQFHSVRAGQVNAAAD